MRRILLLTLLLFFTILFVVFIVNNYEKPIKKEENKKTIEKTEYISKKGCIKSYIKDGKKVHICPMAEKYWKAHE